MYIRQRAEKVLNNTSSLYNETRIVNKVHHKAEAVRKHINQARPGL